MSELPVQPIEDVAVDLSLPREEAEALLLAVDALRPLLERVRAEIEPEPEPEPAPAPVATLAVPDHEDALRRATWLARESLREARTALDERRPTAEQRRAWQEAARRYVASAASRRPTGAGRRNGSS
jgi:hypothetical protein